MLQRRDGGDNGRLRINAGMMMDTRARDLTGEFSPSTMGSHPVLEKIADSAGESGKGFSPHREGCRFKSTLG